MYTGITSASSDQSNIGFILSNQRTKETTYYPAPGAIESSAQRSAEGIVQDLGYQATFPLLLNIGGQPTYFMSLKDGSQLVKMYAMVNVSQYQIVAQGSTVAACESDYIAKLQQQGIAVTSDTAQDILEKTTVEGTVAEIRTAVLGGDSWYYVRLDGSETFYAMAASADRNVVVLNVGDQVSIQTSPRRTRTPLCLVHLHRRQKAGPGGRRTHRRSPQKAQTPRPMPLRRSEGRQPTHRKTGRRNQILRPVFAAAKDPPQRVLFARSGIDSALAALGVAVEAAIHAVLPVGQPEDVGQLLLDGGDAAGILAANDPGDGLAGGVELLHPFAPRMMFTVMWGSM